jgi:uncharacterized membrane protein
MAPVYAQERPRTEAERLATFLGWFSVGLGLAEALAPRSVARLIGVHEEDNETLLRALGARELASGIAILTMERPTTAVMSRVAGDMMDLALLGTAMTASGTDKGRLCGAMAAVAGVAALDVMCSQQLVGAPRLHSRVLDESGRLHIRKSISINRAPEDVYSYWRDFSNLPRFMYHLESVQVQNDRRSHWVAKAPAGRKVEWDAEITEDSPNRIAWRSLPGASVENSGSVSFERGPAGRGTVVRIEVEYQPPAGVAGILVAKMFGQEPEQQIAEDLRRFKQVMETGEVVQSDANLTTRPSPARPVDNPVEVMA